MSRGRLFTVMRQEFKMTAANKAFLIITIIGPFLILAISVLPSLLATSSEISEGTNIAVIGADDQFYTPVSRALEETNIQPIRGEDFASLKEQVLADELHGILVIPDQPLKADTYHYYSKTGTDMMITEVLSNVISTIVVSARLQQENIPEAQVQQLVQQPRIQAQKIKTGGESMAQDFFSIFAVVMTFVMLLYMTVLLYGQMIGKAVLTEKTSKTVEIMLSSVRPVELLFGKIFGKGLAGILQYGIWVGVALALSYLIGPLVGITLPAELSLYNLAFLVLFFVLAFFLYAAAYSAFGSGADDEQHLGQLAWPLILFLVIPLITISAHIMNPGDTFTVILSYFPMTSPIIMLIRVIIDTPPAWEILLSIALLLITIAGFIILAARIFRVGILMTGKRFSIKEILRWVRY